MSTFLQNAQADAAPRGPVPPIPLNVVTGFLGSGKTTLLNRLLKDPALAQSAVLVNEYGEIGLDHLLVDYVEGGVLMLASGCLCCTIRGDLVDALEKLLRDLDNSRISFRRVIVETTGLADPAPVLHTVMAHRYLVMRYRLDGVISVVDAVNGMATLDHHPESVKQAAVADRIALTKTDLLDPDAGLDAKARLMSRLRGVNPAAPILDVAAGEANAGRLLNCGLYDATRKIPDVKRWLAEEAYAASAAHRHGDHDHGHGGRHDGIESFAIASDAPIPLAIFEMFLDLVRSMHGPNLLRVKGIVKVAEHPEQPVVVHGVQHLFHPPTTLPAWPDDDRRTRLVFITKDMDPRSIRDLFGAFQGAASVDRPDRAALTENPLTPFGGTDR